MSERRVPVSRTQTTMTQLVLPQFTNALDTAFGGQIAAWCDVAAAVSAQRFVGGPVVTASMDSLHFRRPIRRGTVVLLHAQVNRAWRTSVEVGVRVDVENVKTGEVEHCCSAYLTFVALGPNGRPQAVPTLDLGHDPETVRRHRDAGIRRDARLEVRRRREQTHQADR